jgi:pimeloyl-ACP methyl ester carboxylesterase
MGTFVLVHGAWAGSLIWRPVARALRQAGHEVYTPTLTGVGERSHLLTREINLDTHIQDVLGVIEYEDLSDVVLVGHSYGGMVVTGVADAVPDQVASLVYLDAFVPEDGQALVNLLPPDASRSRTVPGKEWLALPPPVEAFGEPIPEVREFTARKGSPQPLACFLQPLKLGGGIHRIRRRTFIYCNDPEPTAFTSIYERLKGQPGWSVHTLPCTHFAPLEMPTELTALLQQTMA